MSLPPASVRASWPAPNYINPETRGPGLLIVNVVFASCATVLVALRFYTRVWITGSFGADDVLGFIALLGGIAMCAVSSIAAIHYGWDRHLWDVPLDWLSTSLKLRMAFQITFSVGSTFTKLSLLWFCRRILGAGVKGPFRTFSYCLIGAMVVVASLALTFVLLTIANCIPISASWDLTPTYSYHCLNGNRNVFAASVVNVFTDFLTTVVPMPLIWRLKLPARQRLAVIAIFGLGVTVNIAGSIRTYYTWKDMIDSYDETWFAWAVALAGSIEINLGIICASAPALRPLIVSFIPHLFSSMRGTSAYGQSRRTPRPWNSTARSKNSRVMITSRSQTGALDISRGYSIDQIEIVRTVEMETYYERRQPHHDNHESGVMGVEAAVNQDNVSRKPSETVRVHYIGDERSSSGSRSPERSRSEYETPPTHKEMI